VHSIKHGSGKVDMEKSGNDVGSTMLLDENRVESEVVSDLKANPAKSSKERSPTEQRDPKSQSRLETLFESMSEFKQP
jgi:hypothetical protein